MIGQIINWWNNLDALQSIGIILVFGSFVGFLIYYFEDIRPVLKNKRKSTTQKYREGLIKK